MNFSGIKNITIPEGKVQNIVANGNTIWKKASGDWKDLYQRLEYITRSKGGGWFRTDFIVNNQSGLELSYSVPSFSDTATMGSRASGVTNGRCYVFYPRSATVGYIGWNTAQNWSVSTTANTMYITRLNWLNSRKALILNADGTTKATKSISGTLVQHTTPIDICSYNNGDGRAMSLYGVRATQGDEIVREYIPCLRKSDGQIGLIETISQNFLLPAEGTFTSGPEIEW